MINLMLYRFADFLIDRIISAKVSTFKSYEDTGSSCDKLGECESKNAASFMILEIVNEIQIFDDLKICPRSKFQSAADSRNRRNKKIIFVIMMFRSVSKN